VALLAYVLLSFLYFGLPIVGHPGRVEVGSAADPNIFIWSFAWWPHALLHGLNPVYTHQIWAPSGFDLAWATAVPGLALVFAPVTLLAGPVVAYNVAAVVVPALAAWTAFLLCRYLTHAMWPSLIGGYLFGFSSYMLANEEGHLHLTAVFLVPLVALVSLRFLDGLLSRRGAAWRLGLLLAAQLSISTEVFGTLTLAIAGSLAIAFGSMSSARGRIRSLLVPLASGYAIAAVLASPILYYVLTDFQSASFSPTGLFVTDALNIVVPTRTAAAGGGWASSIVTHFSGENELERSAYLGVPVLMIVSLFLIRRRTDPAARFLVVSLAAAVVASFGSALHVDGHRIVWLPWSLVAGLPIFDNSYPARLMLYASLAAAVIVALWIASSEIPMWFRVALPAIAIVTLLPHLGDHRWDQTPRVPAFFAHGYYKRCLASGENVLVIPYGFRGHSLLWQARSGFEFRMAGGEISDQIPASFVPGFSEAHVVAGLIAGGIPIEEGASVFRLAREKGVGTILVDKADPWPWRSVLAGNGRPKDVGGMLLYSVGTPTSSCTRESGFPETRPRRRSVRAGRASGRRTNGRRRSPRRERCRPRATA
jgi:hypothetical protein